MPSEPKQGHGQAESKETRLAAALEPDEVLMGTEAISPFLKRLEKRRQGDQAKRPKILPAIATGTGPGEGAKAPSFPPYTAYTRTTALFLSLFKVGEDDNRTHAFDLLDNAPAYYYSRRLPELKPGEKVCGPIEREYDHNGKLFGYQINPVWVEDVDEQGNKIFKQKYPGEREEFVYEGLKYLAARRNVELLNGDVGFQFTLTELQTLLSDSGHSYSYTQLRNAMLILCKSAFQITSPDKEQLYAETRLTAVSFNGRGVKTKCYVKFCTLATQALGTVGYKGMDFKLFMSLRSLIARRLYLRLCMRFTYASFSTFYRFAVSSMLRNAGVAAVGKPSRWAREAEEAIKELKERKQVHKYIREDPIKDVDGNTIDYVFRLYPAPDLIRLIASDNTRRQEIRAALGLKKEEADGEEA